MLSNRVALAIVAGLSLFALQRTYRQTPTTNARPIRVQPAANTAESQRESVLVLLAGAEARLNELDRQTKQYKDEEQAKCKSDPICAELEKVIGPLQKVADRKHASPDTYTGPDIERADMDVELQRERLLERQAQFGDDAPLLSQLRHDRITLATELAELQAQARAINSGTDPLRRINQAPPLKDDSQSVAMANR
jgi:hypothetical protein